MYLRRDLECVASKDWKHHEMSMDYLDGGIVTLATLGELRKQFNAEDAA